MILTVEVPDDLERPMSLAERLFNLTREQILLEALDYWFDDGARRPASRELDALSAERDGIQAILAGGAGEAGEGPPVDDARREELRARLREIIGRFEAARARCDAIVREMSAALGDAAMAAASARVDAASRLVDRIVGAEDD